MTTKTSKVALVTGGSRGLGKDMATQLAKKGFDIILTYHSQEQAAKKVVEEIQSLGKNAEALQLDVVDINSYDQLVNQVKEILEKYGVTHLHSLVNNAGVGAHTSIVDTSEAVFDNMVDIHLKAPYFLTQKLLPILEDGGSIVNISSGLARFSFPNYAPYAIMKAAIESLSRYQAQEFGNRKIRVNTVAPGAIETDFGGGALRNSPDLQNIIAGNTALGRIGYADDLGGVVAFLCSEEAKWVNAQRIEVSGGFNI
ncbi:NAD(P)-dependent dehydrogenase, short-chain alcohol dehydrogenase family [Flavobacterium sp. 9AF]|uniref:SDR family NAD(P)-dependent oxidoreductase n=1 Tax=Flavobacterium sp. 9AF TaxID=2653142 RepID=UPI0012F0BC64|nr:SDR family oxidoreductase [Flavobacterium sp. 9AF]VXB59887.1 NAD(P)-dependent dehydrogenase, short-chain alcohol dehydrogenase family [Flavobacterium sp. 9AF]